MHGSASFSRCFDGAALVWVAVKQAELALGDGDGSCSDSDDGNAGIMSSSTMQSLESRDRSNMFDLNSRAEHTAQGRKRSHEIQPRVSRGNSYFDPTIEEDADSGEIPGSIPAESPNYKNANKETPSTPPDDESEGPSARCQSLFSALPGSPDKQSKLSEHNVGFAEESRRRLDLVQDCEAPLLLRDDVSDGCVV